MQSPSPLVSGAGDDRCQSLHPPPEASFGSVALQAASCDDVELTRISISPGGLLLFGRGEDKSPPSPSSAHDCCRALGSLPRPSLVFHHRHCSIVQSEPGPFSTRRCQRKRTWNHHKTSSYPLLMKAVAHTGIEAPTPIDVKWTPSSSGSYSLDFAFVSLEP